MFVPHHVHVDLVANYLYAVLLAQPRHGFQLFAGPYLAGGVMRTVQQQHGITRLSQYPFQLRHIAAPLMVVEGERNRRDAPLVAFNGFIKAS